MAETEGGSGSSSRNVANTSSGKQYIPTRTHSLPQGLGDSHWYSPASETPTYHLYDCEDHHDPEHGKKSILVRVKEKAKRWRQMLGKKRHGRDEPDDTTPPWGVSLNETDADDPEYHGAPMYESEMAIDTCKRPPVQMVSLCQYHPTEQISEVHHPDVTYLELEMKESNDVHVKQKQQASSKIDDLQGDDEPTHGDRRLNGGTNGAAGDKPLMASEIREQKWVRGPSMREYLMQKLEPREEHRALSRVITDAVSPRAVGRGRSEGGGGGGVVEKVKEAVRSLLSGNVDEVQGSSPIPLSTNPFSEIVDDQGRTIQAYIN